MKRPMPGTICALCGQADGHSARCSVTRNGVDPELYRVECMLHEQAANAACEYSDAVDRLTEGLHVARSALLDVVATRSTDAWGNAVSAAASALTVVDDALGDYR